MLVRFIDFESFDVYVIIFFGVSDFELVLIMYYEKLLF